MTGWIVLGRGRLSGAERTSVEHLRNLCEDAQQLDLERELDEADHLDRPIHFLAVAAGDLIGYAAITAGADAEACGMVHPGWRRRGVATQLLDAVLGAARALGRDSVLLICEDAAPAAIAWLTGIGAALESAERRMVARLASTSTGTGPGDASIEVRVPRDADRAALIALLHEGSSLDHPTEADEDPLEEQPGEVRLVATDQEAIIGTLRLIDGARRSMIYALVIDKQRRGQRLGTRVLAIVLEQLRSEGVVEVGLEVDPDNTPAVRLYEGFGFETVTTYRYLRLASAAR